jgi:FG-GAP-like repeat/Bacterial Ig-like domain (group 3)
MRRSLFGLLITLAVTVPAAGACVERRFIPNLPPVTTFNPNSALRARAGVAADFDGDGLTDIAVVGPVGAIVYGTATGLDFARTVTWTSSIEPTQIVTADFNGDGRPDVAMADSSTIVVRLTRSDGTLGPEQVIHHAPANDDSISGLATGDFDGDGRQDLLVAGANFITTYRGLGDGTFTRLAALPVQPYRFRHDMVVADFNHDGRLDVAAASFVDAIVIILRGNGDGTFTFSQQVTFATDPTIEVQLVAADFDGDLQTDLAVAVGGHIALLMGNGDATFHAGPIVPVDWTQIGAPQRLLAADFDRDTLPDLLVVGSARLARFWNLGGHFDTPELFTVSGENIPTVIKSVPIDAFLIDVDSDHWLDVVELDSLGFVAVLLNGCGNDLFLRSSSDSVVDGDPVTLTLVGIDGLQLSPTDYFDNGVLLGSASGPLTASLHGAGAHLLSAASGSLKTPTIPVIVHDHLSTIGIVNTVDHSVYGEGFHVMGGVATDTGELPHFGNVEILEDSTVLATGSVVDGAFDILFKPDAGSYVLTARYAGAGPWPRSDLSSSFRHAVSFSPTTISITTTASSICDLKFPPFLNGTWTVTVSATAPFATPVGTVTLSIPQLGFTQSAGLVEGRAAFPFNRVPVGTYAMTATYTGGGDFTPSQATGTFDIPRCRRRVAGH